MELGDYYAAYIAMKERKKDWTAYLSRLQDSLVKRMDEVHIPEHTRSHSGSL